MHHKAFASTQKDNDIDGAQVGESKSLGISDIEGQTKRSYTRDNNKSLLEGRDDMSNNETLNPGVPQNKMLSALGDKIKEGKALAPGNLFMKTNTEYDPNG